MLKAIETVYNGYRFRSRLEARWAVFFDALGIAYEYEPQGFVVGCNTPRRYLPDFFLPEPGCWVEVKGSADQLDFQLLADAVDWGHGLPGTEYSHGTSRGVLLLGPIPNVGATGLPLHPIFQHSKGGWAELAQFSAGTLLVDPSGAVYFDSSWGNQEGADWISWVREQFAKPATAPPRRDAMSLRVERAYIAARQSRFEHGETPRGPRV